MSLEKLLESASHPTLSSNSHFPVIIGNRSTQGRSQVNSTQTPASKPYSPNTSPSIAPSNGSVLDVSFLISIRYPLFQIRFSI